MRRMLRSGALSVLLGFGLTACVVEPPAGSPTSPSSGVVPADARALRYGASVPEVFNNPLVRDKILALFGPDWNPGGRLTFAAPAFFPPSSPLRSLRLGDQDYIAITGCVSTACTSHRGLLLIRQDGGQLMARLDEGGFSHYYDFAPGANASTVPRDWIDSAWRAVQFVERG
jgi:hypothetical protein